MAYLPDQSFKSVTQSVHGGPASSQSACGGPAHSQSAHGQSACSRSAGAGRPSVDQPSGPILPLLSLQLQTDLNVLARTLTPQALQYVHIGIQIGRTLSN